MKRKPLLIAAAALVIAAALWVRRSDAPADDNSSASVTPTGDRSVVQTTDVKLGTNTSAPVQHRPPNQLQKFREFTPEQRVEFARRGHGPGG